MFPYQCASCGISGVKLWCVYGTGACQANDLACYNCANKIAKETDRKKYSFEEIGDYVRAIPTIENNGYYSFINVPKDRVKWWNSLPL